MIRRLVTCSVLLSLALVSVSITLWSYNQYAEIYLVWTRSREHNQLIFSGGSVHFFQNHNWWRHEPLTFVIDPVVRRTSPSSTHSSGDWIGVSEVTTTGFLGLEHAQGKWQAPYNIVPPDTRFTSDHKIAIGTNFSSTTRFDLYSIPIWFITVIGCVLPSVAMIEKYRCKRRPQVNTADEETPGPASVK